MIYRHIPSEIQTLEAQGIVLLCPRVLSLKIYLYFFLQLFISYVRVTQRFKLLQRKALYKYVLLLL